MPARFLIDSIHSRSRSAIALMVIVALFAAFPLTTVAAQEPPGALFTGVGFIDDHSVEDGTVVEAWVRGIPVAATEIFNQGFMLYVAEPPRESFDGEVVRFKFRGLETNAAADWVEGTESWILLYAYTGLQGNPAGSNGNVTPGLDPDDINALRELRARLLELERGRLELGAEFERQAGIEIANVTNRWEGAIADLRAEVERQIQQVKRKFELQRRQITLGPRRDAILRRLNAELDAFIREKWVEFEFDVQVKQRFLDNEILEMAQARGFKLNSLNRAISQIESELERRLETIGIRFDEFLETGVIEYPVIDVARNPDEPRDEEKGLFTPEIPLTPEIPSPGESGHNRGFFFNSISADPNGLNRKLDPTTLAVIGILITLAATGVQLVKGN